MSDSENVETKKRGGRVPNTGTDNKSASTPKKRPRASTPSKKDSTVSSDSEIPAKRGRGRPKGTIKKSGGDKGKKGGSGKGRGRPKAKKNDSTEEENTDEENDDNEDEAEVESGSD